MKSARVVLKGGIPFNPEFDDIYFNADDPIGQSEYVFNSVFDEIWEKKSEFNVLEAGFGAGLNFLCAFKRFKNSDKFLNFVSIEKAPIAKDDLARIYANFSELADVSGELLGAYPPLICGFHRLNLAPNVTLTLCFGDVADVLDELSFSADAIFMDGFAPAKNEAMWSELVCAKIANLCALGASVCTYSASGALKRALQNSGFEVYVSAVHDNRKNKSTIATITDGRGTVKEYVVLQNDLSTYFGDALKKELMARGANVNGMSGVVVEVFISEFEANMSGYGSDNTKGKIKITLKIQKGDQNIIKNISNNETKFELIRTGGAFKPFLTDIINDAVKRTALAILNS